MRAFQPTYSARPRAAPPVRKGPKVRPAITGYSRPVADLQLDATLLSKVTSVLHLVGPGGAGKTSVGPFLAQRLGWRFVDLDERFMAREGSIGASIEASGYAGYAKRNVAVYREVKHSLAAPTVLALSSGFLTYPEDVHTEYQSLRCSIESDALTSLLLPAFELEACVEIIVRRQLSRPYLPGNRASEERRIRERFPRFMALPCARFQSDAAPDQTASHVERFVRGRGGVLEQAITADEVGPWELILQVARQLIGIFAHQNSAYTPLALRHQYCAQ